VNRKSKQTDEIILLITSYSSYFFLEQICTESEEY
jgi:hypothetical protein